MFDWRVCDVCAQTHTLAVFPHFIFVVKCMMTDGDTIVSTWNSTTVEYIEMRHADCQGGWTRTRRTPVYAAFLTFVWKDLVVFTPNNRAGQLLIALNEKDGRKRWTVKSHLPKRSEY